MKINKIPRGESCDFMRRGHCLQKNWPHYGFMTVLETHLKSCAIYRKITFKSNNSQKFKIDEDKQNLCLLINGIPQRSSLGSLIFDILLNDTSSVQA